MFACDFGEKIFQTLPGQGWHVLIQWSPEEPDKAEGFPEYTLEPVIAFVTLKIPRTPEKGKDYEDVLIAPMVRYPDGKELTILDSRSVRRDKYVFLTPGEELGPHHFEQLVEESYSKGVTL